MTAEANSLWRPAFPPLCLRASSRTGQNHSPVLFQDSAITSGKTIVLRTQKPNYLVRSRFFSEAKRNGVFPLMMSIVAEQRVLLAGLVRELAHRHRAVTVAQMLEEQRHQQRGFDGFC